jgi:O-antigen ligase
MLLYRWWILCFVLILVIYYKLSELVRTATHRALPINPTISLLFLTYIWAGASIFDSVNFKISLLKWLAFLSFLIFCNIYVSLMNSRKQIIESLTPIILSFILIIWATPLAMRHYPQGMLASLGAINGFFVYTNQMGQFFATFGTPSVVYLLSQNQDRWKGIFLAATLGLSVYFTIASKTRAATVITLVILAIALYRWDSEKMSGYVKIFLAGLLAAALFMNLGLTQRVTGFLFKYEDTARHSDLLASRRSYWENTVAAYEKRKTFGYGFGVQEGLERDSQDYRTAGGGREQGSTVYGLLEEIGMAGCIPIFLCLLWMGYGCGISVLRSRDPLELFLSRVFLTGLGLALVENYLLYLGNACSILVFFAFFMRERLLSLSFMNLSQKRSPHYRLQHINTGIYRKKVR